MNPRKRRHIERQRKKREQFLCLSISCENTTADEGNEVYDRLMVPGELATVTFKRLYEGGKHLLLVYKMADDCFAHLRMLAIGLELDDFECMGAGGSRNKDKELTVQFT